jgi:hypothetical protein
MSRMLLTLHRVTGLGAAYRQVGVQHAHRVLPVTTTTVVGLDIDTSFEDHRWRDGSAWTYADACRDVGLRVSGAVGAWSRCPSRRSRRGRRSCAVEAVGHQFAGHDRGEVRVGARYGRKIEASTTWRPSTPRTRQPGSTTVVGSPGLPIRQVLVACWASAAVRSRRRRPVGRPSVRRR